MTPAARRRKTMAKHRETAEAMVHVNSERSTYSPIFAGRVEDPALFRSSWSPDNLRDMFAKARSLFGTNDFVGGVHQVKLTYFADGFHFDNDVARMKKWLDKVAVAGLDVERFDTDIWTEFLLCDSAIVFWRTAENGIALPVVLDCEICEYSDALGVQSLKVKPARCKLSDAQKTALGPRWSDALSRGATIEIDPARGENFRVLTRGKLGGGLGWPRLRQVLDKLGTRELLELADWGAAWEHGDIFRQIKKGHEIRNGDHAGEPTHFITAKASAKIQADNKGKRGPRTLVSNFDVDVGWKFLDPRFFDEKKYAAVAQKLRAWAGPAGLIYEAGHPSPNLMASFGTEGRFCRGLVGRFLASILNDPTFYGRLKPPQTLVVGYNKQSFLDAKLMLEWVRAGSANGHISPQTAREVLGLDNETEGDLLEEAGRNPQRYRPVFEAKQGLLDPKGGRPSDKPGAQTNSPVIDE